MKFLSPFWIAMSMYTRIPVPAVDWNEKNMRNALCFFPVAGICVGVVLIGLYFILHICKSGPFLFGAIAVLGNLLVTGGIHMDGFCDTVDALSSHRSREEKLRIMKDSRCGAFSVMWMCVCLLIQCASFSAFYDVDFRAFLGVCMIFILSRALSGISVAVFQKTPTSSLASLFSRHAAGYVPWILGVIFIIAAGAGMLFNWILGSMVTAAILFIFFYYRYLSQKQFGGITGDVAGYFLVLAETICLCLGALILKG